MHFSWLEWFEYHGLAQAALSILIFFVVAFDIALEAIVGHAIVAALGHDGDLIFTAVLVT